MLSSLVWINIIVTLYPINSNAFSLHGGLPCDFFDSTNITDGVSDADGVILFEGVSYPNHLYAEVGYVLENRKNGTVKVPKPLHMRGCLCEIKKCIRLCCPHGQFMNSLGECYRHEAANQLETEVYQGVNDHTTVVLNDHFGYVDDRPCSDDKIFETKNHKILHTGDIVFGNTTYKHRRYCLQASYDEESKKVQLTAYTCEKEDDNSRKHAISYGMICSIQFIAATVIIYSCITELKNAHSKCLLGYLIYTLYGYILLSILQLSKTYIEPFACKLGGCLTYFAFLTAFFWLNVISFNVWLTFRRKNEHKVRSKKKLFFLYSVYAFGMAFIFTFIVNIADESESLPDYLRPGIGTESCFINRSRRAAQFLFFYLPMLISIAINITFFMLAAKKIKQVEEELNKSKESEDFLKQQLCDDKENFSLFLLLSIVMGATWCLEPLSWLIAPTSWWLTFTDIITTSQGLFIFILFVFRRRVARLLKKRFCCIRGAPDTKPNEQFIETENEDEDGIENKDVNGEILEDENENKDLNDKVPEHSSDQVTRPIGWVHPV